MTSSRSLTIAAIAAIAHAANAEVCRQQGDTSQPSWDDAPDWQKDSAVLGVTKILSGEVTRPEQSHESWLAQKVADGWVHGEFKDAVAKTHPCLVPYDQLPESQRAKDFVFLAVAKALAPFAVWTPAPARIPDSVTREQDRDIYHATNLARGAIKAVAESVNDLRKTTIDVKAGNSETVANITLGYRHLEDASMRLGKALQSLDGGVSVYDRATTVGA